MLGDVGRTERGLPGILRVELTGEAIGRVHGGFTVAGYSGYPDGIA